jgi:transposase
VSGLASLSSSVEELRTALAREREVCAQLREVIESQAGLHAAELAVRDAVLAERDRQLAELADRVSQLERQAGRDSSTSGRPPSSDSPYTKERKKPRDRSLREKTGRLPGKQHGAPGSTLERVSDPDKTVVCPPRCCRGCAADLSDAAVEAVNRRQVFDPPPPPPRPYVTEFEVQARRCGRCGTLTEGEAPAGAAGRAQYGPDTHAHAANLVCGNHIPAYRAAGLMAVMLGVSVSVGFVAGVRGKAAGRLGPFMDRVRALLREGDVLHVDETTARAEGDLTYVHVACTEFLTHLHTGGRSAADIDAGRVLVGYSGTIVRDGYAGYHHLVDALHAWCAAHNLRDLEDVYRWDPDGQNWATRMAGVLVKANKTATAARQAGKVRLDDADLERIRVFYRSAALQGLLDNEGRRTAAAKRARTLARRFRDNEDVILRFATDLAVGFTNNQAERDARPVKVQMRGSGGCWRTLNGLAEFATVQSYLSTAAKWGIDKIDALKQLFTDGPWLPPATAPAQ